MAFDSPEEDLLFTIRQALRNFKLAPPRKSYHAAMSYWRDGMAEHILAHFLRRQPELGRKPPQEIGAGAIMPKPDGASGYGGPAAA
jgi:hypothetical protein